MVVSVTLPTEVGWLLCVAVEAAGAAAEEVEEERGVSGKWTYFILHLLWAVHSNGVIQVPLPLERKARRRYNWW